MRIYRPSYHFLYITPLFRRFTGTPRAYAEQRTHGRRYTHRFCRCFTSLGVMCHNAHDVVRCHTALPHVFAVQRFHGLPLSARTRCHRCGHLQTLNIAGSRASLALSAGNLFTGSSPRVFVHSTTLAYRSQITAVGDSDINSTIFISPAGSYANVIP